MKTSDCERLKNVNASSPHAQPSSDTSEPRHGVIGYIAVPHSQQQCLKSTAMSIPKRANTLRVLLCSVLLSALLLSCHDKQSSRSIRGIYGSPIPFWDRGRTLPELGVNAVFLHGGSITSEIMDRARQEGVMVFAEFPTLNGKNYVESHPEAWAINAQGGKSEGSFVVPEGTTVEQADWILKNHDAEWRSWRCSVLAGWARQMKQVLIQERPGGLLGMFHCSWTDEEYGGARRRTLGIDYDSLRSIVDVFSPMAYH